MSVIRPNISEAPATTYNAASLTDRTDIFASQSGIYGTGVISGMGVTASGSLSLAVAAGNVSIAGVGYTYAGGTATITTNSGGLDRRDVVVARVSGGVVSIVVLTGTNATYTPAATLWTTTSTGNGPLKPDIVESTDCVLCEVFMPYNATVVAASAASTTGYVINKSTSLTGLRSLVQVIDEPLNLTDPTFGTSSTSGDWTVPFAAGYTAAAAAATTYGGARMTLPAGTFKVGIDNPGTPGLQVGSNIKIQGAGRDATIVQSDPGMTANVIQDANYGTVSGLSVHPAIDGLTVTCSSSAPTNTPPWTFATTVFSAGSLSVYTGGNFSTSSSWLANWNGSAVSGGNPGLIWVADQLVQYTGYSAGVLSGCTIQKSSSPYAFGATPAANCLHARVYPFNQGGHGIAFQGSATYVGSQVQVNNMAGHGIWVQGGGSHSPSSGSWAGHDIWPTRMYGNQWFAVAFGPGTSDARTGRFSAHGYFGGSLQNNGNVDGGIYGGVLNSEGDALIQDFHVPGAPGLDVPMLVICGADVSARDLVKDTSTAPAVLFDCSGHWTQPSAIKNARIWGIQWESPGLPNPIPAPAASGGVPANQVGLTAPLLLKTASGTSAGATYLQRGGIGGISMNSGTDYVLQEGPMTALLGGGSTVDLTAAGSTYAASGVINAAAIYGFDPFGNADGLTNFPVQVANGTPFNYTGILRVGAVAATSTTSTVASGSNGLSIASIISAHSLSIATSNLALLSGTVTITISTGVTASWSYTGVSGGTLTWSGSPTVTYAGGASSSSTVSTGMAVSITGSNQTLNASGSTTLCVGQLGATGALPTNWPTVGIAIANPAASSSPKQGPIILPFTGATGNQITVGITSQNASAVLASGTIITLHQFTGCTSGTGTAPDLSLATQSARNISGTKITSFQFHDYPLMGGGPIGLTNVNSASNVLTGLPSASESFGGIPFDHMTGLGKVQTVTPYMTSAVANYFFNSPRFYATVGPNGASFASTITQIGQATAAYPNSSQNWQFNSVGTNVATGNPGLVDVLTPQAYNAGTTYLAGQTCNVGGTSYVFNGVTYYTGGTNYYSLAGSNAGNTPATSPSYWQPYTLQSLGVQSVSYDPETGLNNGTPGLEQAALQDQNYAYVTAAAAAAQAAGVLFFFTPSVECGMCGWSPTLAQAYNQGTSYTGLNLSSTLGSAQPAYVQSGDSLCPSLGKSGISLTCTATTLVSTSTSVPCNLQVGVVGTPTATSTIAEVYLKTVSGIPSSGSVSFTAAGPAGTVTYNYTSVDATGVGITSLSSPSYSGGASSSSTISKAVFSQWTPDFPTTGILSSGFASGEVCQDSGSNTQAGWGQAITSNVAPGTTSIPISGGTVGWALIGDQLTLTDGTHTQTAIVSQTTPPGSTSIPIYAMGGTNTFLSATPTVCYDNTNEISGNTNGRYLTWVAQNRGAWASLGTIPLTITSQSGSGPYILTSTLIPGAVANNQTCTGQGITGTWTVTAAPSRQTITNVALASNVVTITTAQPHGWVAGMTTTIAATTNTAVNGVFPILATPTATTFTYSLTGGPITSTPDTGTVQGMSVQISGGTGAPVNGAIYKFTAPIGVYAVQSQQISGLYPPAYPNYQSFVQQSSGQIQAAQGGTAIMQGLVVNPNTPPTPIAWTDIQSAYQDAVQYGATAFWHNIQTSGAAVPASVYATFLNNLYSYLTTGVW